MAQASFGPVEARILANVLRGQRVARGLSMRALGRIAHCNLRTVSRLEAGTNLSPHLDTLRNLARALELPLSDLFISIGWLPPDELPELRPYLRSKYRDLTDADVAAIHAFAEKRREQHGGTGPTHREDELPET